MIKEADAFRVFLGVVAVVIVIIVVVVVVRSL